MKIIKKLTALLLMFALCASFLFGCSDTAQEGIDAETEKAISNQLFLIADNAYGDLIDNYWVETADGGYFHNRFNGGRDTLNELVWTFTMPFLAMETYYYATGDESVLDYLSMQLDTYYTKVDQEWLLGFGAGKNNIANDDATCTAMFFMLAYRLLGDEKALDYCHAVLTGSYDYWEDGTTENGIWYCHPQDKEMHDNIKSLYAAGLILTELEYYEATKGTEREDQELHERSMAFYEWIEKNMRRDGERTWKGKTWNYNDNLYFVDFIDDKVTGAQYPKDYQNAKMIIQTRSWTGLYVNMSMSVINARLYKMTGDKKYLDKSVSTANALVTTDYNRNGAFLNDRDAWANSAYLGFFVREVMPLEGVDSELGRMLLQTTVDIMKNTHYEGGFYGADWDGSGIWLKHGISGEHTTWITTNATSMHMIFAAYAAQLKGYIPLKAEDLLTLQTNYPLKELDANGNVVK